MEPLSRRAALLAGIGLLFGFSCFVGDWYRLPTGVLAATVHKQGKEERRYEYRLAALPPQAYQGQQLTVEVNMEDGQQCWIFSHLQKTGGSTIKKIILNRWGAKRSIYDSPQWLAGDDYAESYAKELTSGQQWHVIAGGYTEALRPYVGDACKWFTIFRHPISRMVSAYFYCHKFPQDLACGSNAVKAADVDLIGFAKHWGNFALRQFALSLVNIGDVVENAVANGAGRTAGQWDDPGWYLLKMYLENEGKKFDHGGDGQSLPDRAMYDILIPIQNVLRNNFAVVGILEEFDATLELYDRALGMPELEWNTSFREVGIRNADDMYYEQEQQALAAAWTNAELKQYIWLDLLLYEQAVAVFLEQKKQYGIK